MTSNVPLRSQTINGKSEPWPADVVALWNRIGPVLDHSQRVTQANYYTPRPVVDEFNRGSSKFGFVFTIVPGHKVGFVDKDARDWADPIPLWDGERGQFRG